MKTVIREYTVYEYMELFDEAKEKAKQWYLDDSLRVMDFYDQIVMDLKNLFPNSDLKPQFSLSSCQGDGVNIYGDLNINDILNLPSSGICGDQFNNMLEFFTEKELKTLQCYMKECGETIKLPRNPGYAYCFVDRMDVEEWSNPLWEASFRNINTKLLTKLKAYIANIILKLCWDYENEGYKYLYEIDDETMKETCDANQWYFLEDGTFFSEGDE